MKSDSIALRLSGLFALVALLVFTLIGWALYLQVDKSMALLPEAEADARYSVLESAVNRHSDVEHWGRIKTKLRLLSEEDKRLRAKLDGPFEQKLLHTIRGMGYVLESRDGEPQ